MNTRIKRVVNYALPRRRGVARAGDRVEGAVLVAAVAIALLGVPVAAAVGSEAYAAGKVTAADQGRTRHRAEATLLADAPPASDTPNRGVAVRETPTPAWWRGPDGAVRRGDVVARAGAKAGAPVPIWVDDTGAPTSPPLTSEGALVGGIVLALALWGGLAGGLALVWLAVRAVRGRSSASSWEREWALVEPAWTGRVR